MDPKPASLDQAQLTLDDCVNFITMLVIPPSVSEIRKYGLSEIQYKYHEILWSFSMKRFRELTKFSVFRYVLSHFLKQKLVSYRQHPKDTIETDSEVYENAILKLLKIIDASGLK